MQLGRWLVLLIIWALVRQLDGASYRLTRNLARMATLRRELLIEPAQAIRDHCGKQRRLGQAGQLPTRLSCLRTLTWRANGDTTRDVCLDPPSRGDARLRPRRRYDLTLACQWRLGPLTRHLPLLKISLFR